MSRPQSNISYPLILVLLLSIFAWSGCEVINPEETKPATVRIDSFRFIGNPALGTSSQKITSVWAYFNNTPLGAFELPANIPVVTDVPGKLTLVPGITYSALNNYQTIYPFFVSDTATITPGTAVTITPTTYYFGDSLLRFWQANFDSTNVFIKLEGDTTITRVIDPSLVFEGGGSGYIYLRSPQTTATSIASEPFLATGNNAYLELNYKCSMPFVIGIATFDANGDDAVKYLIGLNPKNEWNKVYIDLSTVTGGYPGKPYRLILKANLESGTEGFVSIDNIKAVSLK